MQSLAQDVLLRMWAPSDDLMLFLSKLEQPACLNRCGSAQAEIYPNLGAIRRKASLHCITFQAALHDVLHTCNCRRLSLVPCQPTKRAVAHSDRALQG